MIITVTLDGLWLNSALDPTDARYFEANSIVHSPAVTVSAVAYAGGVFRMKSTPGRQQMAQVGLLGVTDDGADWLKAHLGAPVWYRDARALKFCGFYSSDTNFTPAYINDYWSVPLTFTGITRSEAV